MDNSYPLTDRAEVEECRRWLSWYYSTPITVEIYDSAAELDAARDLEEWGCDPFATN